MFPDSSDDDVPITHVTNGAHLPTFLSAPFRALFDRHLGEGWERHASDPSTWEPVAAIPNAELWAARCAAREQLIRYVGRKSEVDRLQRGESLEYVRGAATALHADVLTLGFARRLATYKRVHLLVHDPERATRLLTGDPPIQLLVAGKAHPKDEEGKNALHDVFALKRQSAMVAQRLVVLEDYDLFVGRELVGGCDVWINLPRRPMEASGTSGMKATFNGALQLSVLDGWWAEAFDGTNGWAIPANEELDPPRERRARRRGVLHLLEQEVVPLFYARGEDGIPHGWCELDEGRDPDVRTALHRDADAQRVRRADLRLQRSSSPSPGSAHGRRTQAASRGSRPPLERAACSCIRPRFREDGSARRPTDSSIGSCRRASGSGKCSRSGLPTGSALRMPARRRSRAGPTLIAEPDAPVSARELTTFRRRHAYWIDDWVEYVGDDGELAAQVRFDREWGALRTYANRRGVRIIGDIPLYVARESADVVAHAQYFDLGLDAGVPPDLFSRTGQLWGNPTYRWGALREDGYRWWVERFRRVLQLVDIARLDHFRGYVAYWAVPHGRKTAVTGRWVKGPSRGVFDVVRNALGGLPVIAEDLGHITPPVHRLRDELGIPGMHIIQWGFGAPRRHPDRIENNRENAVVYTGSHDNDTTAGWWRTATPEVRAQVDEQRARAGIETADPSWVLIELALSSRSRLAIVQAQDVLGLGSDARMNTPSTIGGNWEWRLEPGQLTEGHAERLLAVTKRRQRARR